MLKKQKALLLVGSPKKVKSTSESLGKYLLNKLAEYGFSINKLNIVSFLKDDNKIEELMKEIDASDLIILSFPTYVDSLPAHVIEVFEILSNYREKNEITKKQKIIAIANCGFPETIHNSAAVEICRCFSNRVGFEWLGSLALGGGGAISGRSLDELGGMVRNIVKSLDITSEAIAHNQPIPLKAKKFMEKQLIPSWFYTLMGGRGWKNAAKKFGSQNDLYAKPYEK